MKKRSFLKLLFSTTSILIFSTFSLFAGGHKRSGKGKGKRKGKGKSKGKGKKNREGRDKPKREEFSGTPYQGKMHDAHAHITSKVSMKTYIEAYENSSFEKAGLFTRSIKPKSLEKIKNKLGKNFYFFVDLHKREKSNYQFVKGRAKSLNVAKQKNLVHGVGELYYNLSFAPFAPQGIKTNYKSKSEIGILEKAAALGLPVFIHDEKFHEHQDLLDIVKKIPNLKVVLAHLGYIKSPKKVDKLLTNNKQIYTDLSLVTNSRFGPFKRKGLIIKRVPTKKWIKILEKHDDRILVGSDIGADVQRVKRLAKVANDYRILLSHLKKSSAEKIAYKNFEKLFSI